jgi:hypothetical protein
MDRWAAADLLCEAIGERFGSVDAGAAGGLKLRHDGGSCFRSAHYQAEIMHLGIDRSPAFSTTSPRPTASSRSSSRPLSSRCYGSSSSTRWTSYPPASAGSPPTTTERWLLERHELSLAARGAPDAPSTALT